MEMDTTDNGSMSDQIEEMLILTRENNKLLKRIRRDAIIGGILKMAIWALLIVVSFYFSAKFLEPYLGMLQSVGQPQEGGQGVGDFGTLIDQYKGLLGQ